MPKVKTNKTAAKRFKITGTGKVMFEHSRQNHLMMNKKRGGRIRRMHQDGQVFAGEMHKMGAVHDWADMCKAGWTHDFESVVRGHRSQGPRG